jgi:hypothetical protein
MERAGASSGTPLPPRESLRAKHRFAIGYFWGPDLAAPAAAWGAK